jgi:flagellar hook-associated protein FlgK
MNAIASIALSGLASATLRMSTAAHNLANLGTEGATRQAVQQAARPDGGVDASVVTTAGGGLVEDIVELKLASYAFRANLLSLQRADAMLGRLLDQRA